MLKIAIADANAKSNNTIDRYAPVSIVSQWLLWEMRQKDIEINDIYEADIVLFVYAGCVGWSQKANGFKRYLRDRQPYIIAGGQIATMPFTALKYANAVVVGEAFNFVRELLDIVVANGTVEDVKTFIANGHHSIECDELTQFKVDTDRPWLLTDNAYPIASPDEYIDWSIPSFKTDDGTNRFVLSKGCHKKCSFCATSWMQKYQYAKNGEKQIIKAKGKLDDKERVMFVTNDYAGLPFVGNRGLTLKLSAQSLTLSALKSEEKLKAIIASKPNIVRIGVEGLSSRIRKQFHKPIDTDYLLFVLRMLRANKINAHLFYIAGVPYENEEDWNEFEEFYRLLAYDAKWGITRIKFTTFNPQPPTPLVRFVQPANHKKNIDNFLVKAKDRYATRHIMRIPGVMNKVFLRHLADALSISVAQAARIQHDSKVVDLAPTLDQAAKMKHEIIDWPWSMTDRWKIGGMYKSNMT